MINNVGVGSNPTLVTEAGVSTFTKDDLGLILFLFEQLDIIRSLSTE